MKMASEGSQQVPLEINPDLQEERDRATFDLTELTHIIDGGRERTIARKKLEKLLHSYQCFNELRNGRPYQSKSELYGESVKRSVQFFRLRKQLNWSDEEYEMGCQIINHDLALGLHHIMFIPAIERLATEKQKAKWLPAALQYRIIGTYAQTEMGHGTNLQQLETTATFDAETDEFIIHTPSISAMKWWPGALGKSSNHAIVLAMLVIKGEKYGMHPFIVQLRSTENHHLLPGVKTGDLGQKMGFNTADNGYLILENVRIPRENMMMKNAQVSRDGRFSTQGPSKANYATMMLVRVNIVYWSSCLLRDVITIAVRYSAVRRQSKLNPMEEECKILDFQTQQYKLFPALATAYALSFVSKCLRERYNSIFAEISHGNFKSLPELHCQSSGMKALAAEISVHLSEICRQACGGHGYLQATGMSDRINSSRANITIEGENTVLYLQVARYLIKKLATAMSGQTLSGSTSYLNMNSEAYYCPVTTQSDCDNLMFMCDIYRNRAYTLIKRIALKLQSDIESGVQQHIAMNNNLVALTRAAKAHCYYCLVLDYVDSINKMAASDPVTKVMMTLCRFFCVYTLVLHSGEFLETESIGLLQLEWMKIVEVQLLAELRPNAVALVDAFDLPDAQLGSVLGCYDGNVYPRLYSSTLSEPLNQTEVHSSYYTYLKPFIEENNKSKL